MKKKEAIKGRILKDYISNSEFRTQEAFAYAVNITEARISKIVRGHVEPTKEEREKIEIIFKQERKSWSVNEVAELYLNDFNKAKNLYDRSFVTNLLLAGIFKELKKRR